MTKEFFAMPGGLTEEQIRPKEFIKRQKIALQNDICWLLSRKNDFVYVSCPACNRDKFSFKYEKFGLSYKECTYCRTIYINPRPSQDILKWFYENSENYEFWNKFIFPASEQARRCGIIEPRVEEVIKYCDKYKIKRNSILEVGAGFGTFCEIMHLKKEFKRIVGIEPTPGLAQTCRLKGIELIESSIEDVNFEDYQLFNVVVSFEVIEHLFSPRDFVSQCKKSLVKNGLLILSCPNGQGFDITTLNKISKTIDHEHLNYFNPQSLKLLLHEIGFNVLETLTPGKLDAELVRNEILEGNFDVSDQPFLKKVLIDEWDNIGSKFQQFLSENLLSSNMWIIAQNN